MAPAVAAANHEGLVPETYDDFRSVGFWDGFFEKRQEDAFEWYGEWSNMRPVAGAICGGGRKVLMVGCGNSDLSAQMYDDGVKDITNIDFSRVVIKQMMKKNLRARPEMKWQIMDMTAMKCTDGSFDVVMDKGGLDALMGEDNMAAGQAADKFLKEVTRVLSPAGGVYLCVTLAQPHVLDALFSVFQGTSWDAVLHKLKPPADMARAPLQPYLITLTRRSVTATSTTDASPSDVRLAFRGEAAPWMPDHEHLALVIKTVNTHNEQRALERAGGVMQSAPAPGYFNCLRPGRRVVVQLPPPPPTASLPPPLAGLKLSDTPVDASNPVGIIGAEMMLAPYLGRFTASICDVLDAASGAMECAVFLVPQGRELEWLFSCAEGQLQVASSCNARRVILVAINRAASNPTSSTAAAPGNSGLWRDFADLADVQRALSPLVLPLLPLAVRDVPKAVPYMTLGGGIGRRDIRESAQSPMSGEMVVEDIELHSGESATGRWVRRLVFLSNQGRIQSEVPLLPPPANATDSALRPDHSQLTCSYHGGLVAGLCLVLPHLQALASRVPANRKDSSAEESSSSGSAQCLLIGLGGGTLAVFLQRYYGMQVIAVELNSLVVDLARRHFDVDDIPGSGLSIEIDDGVAVAARLASSLASSTSATAAASTIDFLIVDADCGDPALPMSCPPPVFLEPAFLLNAVRLVGGQGVLAVNCVSRAQGAIQTAIAALQTHFSHVYELDVDEDVNHLLFAMQYPATHAFGASPAGHPPTDPAGLSAALVAAAKQTVSASVAEDMEGFVQCLRLTARTA